MNTFQQTKPGKPVSFQLEKTVPGTFLMQGALGGLLGGFVAALITEIMWGEGNFTMTIDLTSLALFAGGIIGPIKGTVMWLVFRLTGIQYRAITRVTATSILAFLFIAVLGRQSDFDNGFLRGSLIWTLSLGLPVAMLVGSRVKPWEIFTFGSIAANGDQRSGSRSILRTLGTLPLRFLSIATTALFLLYAVPLIAKAHDLDEALAMTMYLNIVVFYPSFTAYLTFRSPRKKVLVVIGVLINVPIILLDIIGIRDYLKHAYSNDPFIAALICSSFIVTWTIFLIARLTTKTNQVSLSSVSEPPVERLGNLDHQCLGSRFSEWQQRVA
jgi:hypothetical protein